MRVVCIWRRESDYGRPVEEWLTEFERRYGAEIESYDPDEPEGASLCRTYDIVEYPTLIALDNNGTVLETWRGQQMPTFDEVNYWVMK